MRPLLILAMVFVGCAAPAASVQRRDKPEVPDVPDPEKVEHPFEVLSLPFQRSPRAVYDSTVQHLVMSGFDIVLSDPVTRVVKAQRITKTGTIGHRKLLITVAISDRYTVRAQVFPCSNLGRGFECGVERPGLRNFEVDIAAALVRAAIGEDGPPKSPPAAPAVDM
jgi:hypothetical protein